MARCKPSLEHLAVQLTLMRGKATCFEHFELTIVGTACREGTNPCSSMRVNFCSARALFLAPFRPREPFAVRREQSALYCALNTLGFWGRDAQAYSWLKARLTRSRGRPPDQGVWGCLVAVQLGASHFTNLGGYALGRCPKSVTIYAAPACMVAFHHTTG